MKKFLIGFTLAIVVTMSLLIVHFVKEHSLPTYIMSADG